MPEVVYLLCALTSAVCGALLFRSFRRQGLRLLLWMALCFVGLTLSNVLLCLDLIAFPDIDLGAWRAGIALGALLMLVIGLVWDSP